MVRNGIISIVIRFHNGGRLDYLFDALFSVSLQNYKKTEVVICLQNCDHILATKIEEFCELLGFSKQNNKHPSYKLVSLKSKKDIRAKLLNAGIRAATGRYLGFLDYDDLLYGNAFALHLENLSNDSAVSVGGCRKAILKMSADKPFFIQTKSPWYDKPLNMFEQFLTNRMPIHSFLIDRYKVKAADLYINEKMKVLEDYNLLLRLSAKYKFNYKRSHIAICEYRFRDDNSNTTAFFDTANKKKLSVWDKENKNIALLKKQLRPHFSISDIVDMS